ncbi:MAG: hypothetical protein R3B72_01370 [Polyangiaceae bacterium]
MARLCARAFRTATLPARSLGNDGAATGDQLLSEAQGRHEVRGVSTKDVLAGTSAFVTETGDLDFGRKIQQALAEVALASGADTTDVARDAAALYTNFGVRDAEGMRKALAGQIVQGKRGAFELKDAAQYLPSMAASAAAFDIGKGSNAVARLGGLTQIARESTGRGATAATAVEAMFRQLTAKAPELAKQGVKLTNKDGSRRDIFEVLAETVAKVTDKKALAQGVSARDAKNKGLQNIFGEEGIRAIKPLIATYGEAMAKGEDGMQALRDKMNEASDTTGSLATLQRDLQSAQGDASARLSSAWENFSSQLTDRALPATMKFVERLASVDVKPLVDALGALADGLLNLLTKLGIVSDRPEGKGDFRIKSADEALTAGKLRSEQSKIIMGALENGRSLTDEEIGQLADLREQEFAAEGRREGNVRSATSAGRFMAPTTDNESDHWFLKQDPKTIIQGRVGEAFGGGITQAAANVAGGALKIEGLDQVGRESAQAAREQMTVLQAGFAQVVEALARLNITVETTGGPTAFNEVLGR